MTLSNARNMTNTVFLYVTADNAQTAHHLASTLVRKRLAACVNIIPGMQSVYRWKDEIETAQECVLIVKTTETASKEARQAIIDLHPYDTPCVVALPVAEAGSNPAFLQWIQAELD